MPSSLKFVAPLRLDIELRERARREGRSLSDTILRAVQRGLGSLPSEMPEAVVDRAERGSRGRATACYLSQPLARAIHELAIKHDRSASWVTRDLIRSELKRRGLLLPSIETVVPRAPAMTADSTVSLVTSNPN
jgi:hypothetical protein